MKITRLYQKIEPEIYGLFAKYEDVLAEMTEYAKTHKVELSIRIDGVDSQHGNQVWLNHCEQEGCVGLARDITIFTSGELEGHVQENVYEYIF